MRRWRRQLAVGPDGAIGEMLFFPDGNSALERVDGGAASIEGGGAVRRAYGDVDAGLADFQTSKTMRDGDAVDGEFRAEFGGDFPQLRQSHRFVRFIFKIQRAAAVRIIANATVERDDGAVGVGANVTNERARIDRVVAELDEVVGRSGGHCAHSARRWVTRR